MIVEFADGEPARGQDQRRRPSTGRRASRSAPGGWSRRGRRPHRSVPLLRHRRDAARGLVHADGRARCTTPRRFQWPIVASRRRRGPGGSTELGRRPGLERGDERQSRWRGRSCVADAATGAERARARSRRAGRDVGPRRLRRLASGSARSSRGCVVCRPDATAAGGRRRRLPGRAHGDHRSARCYRRR